MIKQFYLIHWWGPNQYCHSGLEWTRRIIVIKRYSPFPRNGARWFSVVSKTLVKEGSHPSRECCKAELRNNNTCLWKNIFSLFIYESRGEMAVWERERESRSGSTVICCSTRYIYSEPCFFHGRLIQSRFSTRGRRPRLKRREMTPLPTQTNSGVKTSVIIFLRPHIFLPVQFTRHFCCPLYTLRHSWTSSVRNPY